MNKEPIALYILRLLLSIGLLALVAMLYWSSLLVEEDLKAVNNNVNQLKTTVDTFRSELSQLEFSQSATTPKKAQKEERPRPHIDPTLANLLEEDPYFTTTLPKLLGPHFVPHGTFHFDTVGRPDNLHPFSNWAVVSAWTSQCSGSVSRVLTGKYETYAPDLAIKMEERINQTTQQPEYWIHLREGIFWQPLKKSLFSETLNLAPHFFEKHPVTAHDFKFYFDALMNPFNQELGAVAVRTYYNDMQEIEVIDDLTFIVRWKTKEIEHDGQKVYRAKYLAKQLTGGLSPLASFLYKYFADGTKIIDEENDPNIYRTSSVWAQNFTQHWAKNIIPSCGSWVFDGISERQIGFKRNKDHYNPLDNLVSASETQFKESPDALWQDFKSLQTDTYNLQPDQLLELDQFYQSDVYKEQVKQGKAIKRVDYLARQYSYIAWNQAKPYFKSRKVRQALTMAIDRQRIIRELLNGMGEEVTGTFFKNSPSYDPSIVPFPFDLDQAKRNLLEEGWADTKGTGVIEKIIDGKSVPFKFSLTYFVKSPISKKICEFVTTSLKELGIICNLNGVDIADLTAAFDDKSFDALQLAWSLGSPPEDPRQIWSSAGAKEKGSSNMIGFANAQIDAIIDALTYEFNPKKRLELYHQFDRILHEEQPYTFLFTPKSVLLYREYVQNVFIPAKRQDLIPGANVGEPQTSLFWLKQTSP
jgi:peptide/nickel transport system substrate-binding protein